MEVGWDGMIGDLSARFDFTEHNLNSNDAIVDPNCGNAAMVRLVEFYRRTHLQPDGVTSELLFDPDDATIECRHKAPNRRIYDQAAQPGRCIQANMNTSQFLG